MSIADRVRLQELERRVETLESMVKQLYADVHPVSTVDSTNLTQMLEPARPGRTLKLPEKRQ